MLIVRILIIYEFNAYKYYFLVLICFRVRSYFQYLLMDILVKHSSIKIKSRSKFERIVTVFDMESIANELRTFASVGVLILGRCQCRFVYKYVDIHSIVCLGVFLCCR